MSAALGDLTQIPVTTRPTQGLPKLGDVNVTLYNQDITNIVYVSYQQWFAPNSGVSVPIQPLSSITISARRAIYVASLVAGVAPLMVLPEGSQAQPSPAQIAQQINALGLAKETTQLSQTSGATIATDVSNTGVPLLTKSTVLANNTAGTTPLSGTSTSATFTFTQVAYEILLSMSCPAATAGAVGVYIKWTDSISGLVIEQQNWYIYPGSTAPNAHQVQIKGPSGADRMQITFDNTQNASLLSWNLTVLQNSRPLTWHDGKTVAMPAVNGWIAANFDPQANIVATSNPSLAAGAQQTRLMPLYHGYVMAFNNPAGNIAESITFVQSDFNAAALNTYWQFQVNAFGIQLVYMPRAQSSAIIKNNGAATQSCGLAVIGVEY